jgi:hypothetical protein
MIYILSKRVSKDRGFASSGTGICFAKPAQNFKIVQINDQFKSFLQINNNEELKIMLVTFDNCVLPLV